MARSNNATFEALPVVIHMWFRDGDDWAFHPSFQGKLSEVVDALDPILKASQSQVFEIPFGPGYLIGERVVDRSCQDPRAVDRHPFIVRAAFVREYSEDDALIVRGQLSSVIPHQPGSSGQLSVPLRDRQQQSSRPHRQEHSERQNSVLNSTPQSAGNVDELLAQINELAIAQDGTERESKRISQSLRAARSALWLCFGAACVGFLLILSLGVLYTTTTPAMLLGLVFAVTIGIASLRGLSSSLVQSEAATRGEDSRQHPTPPPP